MKLCTEPEIVNAVGKFEKRSVIASYKVTNALRTAFAPRDRAARPNNVSFKDAEECAKCGGKFEPYYEWKALVRLILTLIQGEVLKLSLTRLNGCHLNGEVLSGASEK